MAARVDHKRFLKSDLEPQDTREGKEYERWGQRDRLFLSVGSLKLQKL